MRRSAPGASRRSRSQTQGAGRAGLAEGRGSAHGTIIAVTGVPRRYAPSLASALSALQRHLALLLQPLRMA